MFLTIVMRHIYVVSLRHSKLLFLVGYVTKDKCVVLADDGKLELATCMDSRRLYVKDCYQGAF